MPSPRVQHLSCSPQLWLQCCNKTSSVVSILMECGHVHSVALGGTVLSTTPGCIKTKMLFVCWIDISISSSNECWQLHTQLAPLTPHLHPLQRLCSSGPLQCLMSNNQSSAVWHHSWQNKGSPPDFVISDAWGCSTGTSDHCNKTQYCNLCTSQL